MSFWGFDLLVCCSLRRSLKNNFDSKRGLLGSHGRGSYLLLAYLFLEFITTYLSGIRLLIFPRLTYISIFGALSTLIIFLFIPKFGYMASATATLMAYAVMAFISYFLGQKHYKVPYNLKKSAFI